MHMLLIAAGLFLADPEAVSAPAAALPWKVNRPIVAIKKEMIRPRPNSGGAAHCWVSYIGPNLEMMEITAVEVRDDVATEMNRRFSTDNGRTWSDHEPLADGLGLLKGVEVYDSGGDWIYDPRARAMLQLVLRQVSWEGKPISYLGAHNFTYYRVSNDRGRTWSEMQQLRYEAGDPFDPQDPLKASFLRRNQGYFGQNVLFHSNGTAVLGLAHANAPAEPENDKRGWKLGSLCMIGIWDPASNDYDWTPGERVETSATISARGLMEPSLAELADGRVLIVWRGTKTRETPGHKWFSISTDGGRTLQPVGEWKYADGSPFYSPSSIHQFFRHSVTKKLYWLGNITAELPSGNNPRYPLVIAEVDESKAALKKETVTAIDDRREGQSPAVTYSNFVLLENRETHALELYLTIYGEDARQPSAGDSYKYTLTFSE